MEDIYESRRRRLIELKNTLKINNLTFAKRLKTNPGFISQLLNGHRNVTEAFAYHISKCLTDFNPDWLITGNGDMYFSGIGASSLPAPGLLTGVLEPAAPAYERGLKKIALEDLAGIIESLQREVAELREEVMRLREGEKGRLK